MSHPRVALLFFLHYDHQLVKESRWRTWVESNADFVDIYFHATDPSRITSPWVRAHLLPPQHLVPTSYLHMVEAYMSSLAFAWHRVPDTRWFCLLTQSCVPLVSPAVFRHRFETHGNTSFLRWSEPWWPIQFHRRAHLRSLPAHCRLGHDPWFVLTRDDVACCLAFRRQQPTLYRHICRGGLANESLFAIALHLGRRLAGVRNERTTAVDWSRRTSATSPHVFRHDKDHLPRDVAFVQHCLQEHPNVLFLRKVAPDYPDTLLDQFTRLADALPTPAPVPNRSRYIPPRSSELPSNSLVPSPTELG